MGFIALGLLAALQGNMAPELPNSGWVNGPELDLERFHGIT